MIGGMIAGLAAIMVLPVICVVWAVKIFMGWAVALIQKAEEGEL
jgi:hypothetical protein